MVTEAVESMDDALNNDAGSCRSDGDEATADVVAVAAIAATEEIDFEAVDGGVNGGDRGCNGNARVATPVVVICDGVGTVVSDESGKKDAGTARWVVAAEAKSIDNMEGAAGSANDDDKVALDDEGESIVRDDEDVNVALDEVGDRVVDGGTDAATVGSAVGNTYSPDEKDEAAEATGHDGGNAVTAAAAVAATADTSDGIPADPAVVVLMPAVESDEMTAGSFDNDAATACAGADEAVTRDSKERVDELTFGGKTGDGDAAAVMLCESVGVAVAVVVVVAATVAKPTATLSVKALNCLTRSGECECEG